MNEAEYQRASADPESDEKVDETNTRAARALALALDIRKFEIELYWKRAAYFWGFIAAAFAAYALTYKTAQDHEPWLSLIFSALGLLFSVAWYLVNRGSKFWQQNWERHVDLLEDLTLGPLYKIVIAVPNDQGFLTGAARYSVTKINQLLSLFVVAVWIVLYLRALTPFANWDPPKIAVVIVTVLAIVVLLKAGRSSSSAGKAKLEVRTLEVET